MNLRTLRHAFSRKTILGLVGFGLGLGLWGKFWIAGSVLLGLGFVGGLLWANRKGLSEELYWLDEKKAHNVLRTLKLTEERALKSISAYCERVRLELFEPGLANETMERAWQLIRDASGQNATKELEALQASLPPIKIKAETEPPPVALEDRLQESVDRRARVERQLDNL